MQLTVAGSLAQSRVLSNWHIWYTIVAVYKCPLLLLLLWQMPLWHQVVHTSYCYHEWHNFPVYIVHSLLEESRGVKCSENCYVSGFFSRGTGGPPSSKSFVEPPIRHLSPFLDQGLSPPAEVRPRKFEKFKYIFVSNLTTFKLKSTLKSCISCLK